ncbi:MAG: ATP phosphoribosyltransferase regulatory subunit [Clostridia bacterium]|nr:ATP phosphoribosyltransferase regulatory subunit [Clostridia bacterium]
MNLNESSLSFNEKVIFALRSLYRERGYSQYKMSKFEEYDLYARNKDFLISDSVITFTDTNGKLMALKPDVTLSIIKNLKDLPDCVQKVYYNENVYRISKGSHAFKEIMQTGLECFGDIDNYNICEVVSLAAKSLRTVSESSVLDISHLKLIGDITDSLGVDEYGKKEIIKCISEKNAHELKRVCSSLGVDEEKTELIRLLITTCGRPDEVLPRLEASLNGRTDLSPIKQLREIIDGVDEDIKDMLRIDFSVVDDMKYYNGIVFKGYIEGIPSSVVSGGQYDRLMNRMKRKSGAIGFAVYLDTLERLGTSAKEYDVDTILIYGDSDAPSAVSATLKALSVNGSSVLACKKIPEDIKYRAAVRLSNCEVNSDEKNA